MTINATKAAKTAMKTMLYLKTIRLRVRFCLIEYKGAWICLDGRSQTVGSDQPENKLMKSETGLTQKCRMDLVHERDDERQRDEEQQDVANQEVRTPKRQLDDLDHELAGRLAERMRSQAPAVPLARPPRAVRLIVLELPRQEHGDEDLEDRTLDEDDGDHAQYSMRCVPQLEEPQELEEADHADEGQRMRDEGDERSELREDSVEHRAQEERY